MLASRAPLALFAVLAAAALAACGGGERPTSGSSNGTISGFVVKGPVNGGTVTAYRLDPQMNRGAALGSATTAPNGAYSISLPAYNGPLEIAATGGTYTEEALGTAVTLTREFTTVLADYRSGSMVSATITPISSLATALARSHVASGDSFASAIDTAWTHTNSHYGNVDWRSVVPADLTSSSIGTLSPDAVAGLILAAVSQQAKRLSELSNLTPGVVVTAATLSDALAADAANATFDGSGPGGQLAQGSVQLDGQTARRGLGQAIIAFVQSVRNASLLTVADVTPLANAIASNSDPYLFCAGQTAAPECAGGSLDLDGPTITVSAPPSGGGVRGNVTVSVSATDASRISNLRCTAPSGLNSVAPTIAPDGLSATLTLAYDVSALTDGSLTFTFAASDEFGNPTTINHPVIVANHGPTISITTPNDGATVTGTTTIVGSSSAQTPGATITNFVLLSPAPGTLGLGTDLLASADGLTINWNSLLTPEGATPLHFRATDSYGSYTDQIITPLVDNIPPGVITVHVSVGAPLQGALVRVFAIDNATGTVNTAIGANGVLGTAAAVTDAAGQATITLSTENYEGPIQIAATTPVGASLSYVDPGDPALVINPPASMTLTSYIANYKTGTTLTAPLTYWTSLADVATLAYVRGNNRLFPTTHSLVESLTYTDHLFSEHNFVARPAWDLRATIPFQLTVPPTRSLIDRAYAAFTDVALNQLARDTAVLAGFAAADGVITAPTLFALLSQDLAADGQFDGLGPAGTILSTAGATPVTLDANFMRIKLALALDTFIESPRDASGLTRSALDGAGIYTAIATDTSNLFGALTPVPFDSQAPVPTIAVTYGTGSAAIGGQRYVRGTVTLTVDATDASGVGSITATAGTTPFTKNASASTATHYVATWDSATATDGPVTISVTATDVRGNSGTTTYSITVDNTAPTVAATNPSATAYYSANVPFDVTATDAGVGVASLSAPGYAGLTDLDSAAGHLFATWPIPVGTADGTFAGSFSACDLLGNCAAPASTIRVDRTAPSLSNATTPPTYTAASTLALAISAADAGAGVAAVFARVNGSVPHLFTFDVPSGNYLWPDLPLSVGNNVITVWGTDLAVSASGAAPNVGEGAAPPQLLTFTVVCDINAPTPSRDALVTSFYDERAMTLVSATPPATFSFPGPAAKVDPFGVDGTYKTSARLAWTAAPTTDVLETTNPDNIPFVRINLPLTAGSAPITSTTYSVTLNGGTPITGDLAPWRSNTSTASTAKYDLPISSNLFPALATIQGPIALALTVSVTDAAGNTGTLNLATTVHVIGAPLWIAEDTTWPTYTDTKGAYSYPLAAGQYSGLWNPANFTNNGVRLHRYVLSNPYPMAVGVNTSLSTQSWAVSETYDAAAVPLTCVDANGDGCSSTYPSPDYYLVNGVQLRLNANFWNNDYDYTTWHTYVYPGYGGFANSVGYPCNGWFSVRGRPRHLWSNTTTLFDASSDAAGCYPNDSNAYIFAGRALNPVPAPTLSTHLYRDPQPTGGEITAPPFANGYYTIPAADAYGPGQLVIYVVRPANTARSIEVPLMPWTGTAYTGMFETVYRVANTNRTGLLATGSVNVGSGIDHIQRTMTAASESLAGTLVLTTIGRSGPAIYGEPTTNSVSFTKSITH